MRVVYSLVLLGLGVAIPAAAQDGMPRRPVTYPPGSVGEASRAHLLTLAEARSLIVAMKALETVGKSESGSAGDFSDDSALTMVVAKVDKLPAVKRAIVLAGLTPCRFVVAASAFAESMETAFLQKIVGSQQYPTRVRWENVALYNANAAEFERALGIGAPAAPRPARRAVAPEPGSLNAAAVAHVLTLPEIRRLLAVARDIERAGTVMQSMATSRSVTGLLDHEVRQLSATPPLRRIVEANGFAPRGYLVARAAFDATMMAVRSPELDLAEADLPRPNANNLALVRRHAAEIDSMNAAMSASLDQDERARLAVDVTYQRRLRMMDSLSRFVRTDSLARLFTRAIDAPDAAIPALAQELSCEILRLSWRHGSGPAAVAQRRMKDSLWAGRPEVYARTNERVFAYGMAAPITDEVCRHSRWPKAADSLWGGSSSDADRSARRTDPDRVRPP